MMAAAARSFAIRDSAYATSSRVRNPDLDILPYAFRFETFAFYSNRVWTSHSIPPLVFLSSTPFPSSLITCPSTFLVIFHSSLALAFIFFFSLSLPSLCPLRFSILVLESTGAHSRHARKISKRRIRGEDEGTYIDTYSHPFLRALRLFTAGAEGTRLRAYVRAKSVSKICTKVAPMGEGGGSSVDTRRKRKFARDRDTCSRPLCEISTEERESERSITR